MNMDLCSCFSDLIYTKDRKVFIYLIILGKALLGLHQAWVLWCSGIKLSIQIYQKKKKNPQLDKFIKFFVKQLL